MLSPISSDLLFKGRPGDVRLGQWVSTSTSSDLRLSEEKLSVFIFGCPDDTGVRLNRGRPGAQEGPNEIRRAFYKMTLPMDERWSSLQVVDAGNIVIASEIEQTHKNAYRASESLSKLGTVILLGGGHDFAAPGFLGFIEGRKSQSDKLQFGLINIDPHLDVRELEGNKPHSGTPFRQILNSKMIVGKNLIQFGCRENRNSHSHLNFCKELGVQLQSLEGLRSLRISVVDAFRNHLRSLSKAVDTIGVTLDMDSCSELIGTSAAPAIGFSLKELYEMAFLAGAHPQVHYFELAEVAPSLDPSGKTPLGAAEILYSFLCGKAHSHRSQISFGANKKTYKTRKNTKKSR